MKRVNFLIIVGIFTVCSSIAQYANQQALYNNLPQAKYYNPGVTPDYVGYFSLPALSGYGLSVSNSGFAFKDFFNNKNIDPNSFLATIENKNYLNFGFATDIIGFGFKAKKNFFSINVTPKTDVNFGYNKEVFDFLINGNGSYIGEDISLDGFAFDMSAYLETAIGYNREVTEKISAGGRFKILHGIGNVNGDFNGIKLHTDEDDYSLTATSEFSVNAYGTFIGNDSISEDLGNPSVFNPSNIGLGIDLGASYKYSEKVSFFASIVDLGYIKWSKYGEKLYNDGASFTYTGLPYSEFSNNDEESSDPEEDDYYNNLSDSISSTFKLQRSQISYSTRLKTKLYAGVEYKINNYFEAQALIHGRVYNNKLYPMFMFSGGVHINRWLTSKVVYSGVNRTYDNFGAGLVLHLGAFQMYAMMDNIYGLTRIDYARNLSGSFGINFTFKGEENKKVKKANKKKEKAEKAKEKAEKNTKLSEEEKKKAVEKQEKIIKEQEKEIQKEEKKAESQKKEEKAEQKEEKAEQKEEKAEQKEEQAEKRKEQAEKKEEQAEKKEKQAEKKEEKAEKKEEKTEQKEEKAEQKEEQAEKKEEKVEKKEEKAKKEKEKLEVKEEVIQQEKVVLPIQEVPKLDVNEAENDSIKLPVKSVIPTKDSLSNGSVNLNDSIVEIPTDVPSVIENTDSTQVQLNDSIQSVETKLDSVIEKIIPEIKDTVNLKRKIPGVE